MIVGSRPFAHSPPILTAGVLLYSRYFNYYYMRYAKLRLGNFALNLIIGSKVWIYKAPKFQ